ERSAGVWRQGSRSGRREAPTRGGPRVPIQRMGGRMGRLKQPATELPAGRPAPAGYGDAGVAEVITHCWKLTFPARPGNEGFTGLVWRVRRVTWFCGSGDGAGLPLM